MDFARLQKLGFEIAESQYNTATEAIIRDYKASYKSIQDKIKAVYLKTLDGVDPKDYYVTMIKFERLNNLLTDIAKNYRSAALSAGRTQAQAGKLAVNAAYYRRLYAIDFGVEASSAFAFLPQDAVDISVLGTPKTWKDIAQKRREELADLLPQYGSLAELLNNKDTAILSKLKQAISQGFISGDNYREISRRVREVMNNATYQAERIARTEGVRNLNAGALLATEEARNKGIGIVRQWSASKDFRTRSSHGSADGQKEDQNGNFSVGGASGPYPGQLSAVGENVNCRCAIIDIIDGVQPTGTRAINPVTGKSDIFGYHTYDEWVERNGLVRNPRGELVRAKP